ncbi:Class II abasic (AP) endonuclease [Geranomyces variabilis]|uniref:DNA-(apurinic or apyrimidinic site) endonuclease n=1 Tax=Geranomyces variabilis TaxID=109894 RepID=A0AAD5XQT7_9FUNG|nr:Class II abasic (AP) endonuclease [Geranomyces variabilis]
MRIVSWNVNSIRTLKQYHPWRDHKSYGSVLDALDADIICFQEMKIARSNVDSDLALVPGYDAFFTFPKKRHGYAGSTTYVRSEFTPVDAEEGFTGTAGGSMRQVMTDTGGIGCYGDLPLQFTPAELAEMDSEGRVIITDHRVFVLINAYFPVNDPSEDRQAFRVRFYTAMRMRIDALLAGGRNVILLGDINACYDARDHCDPKKSMRENGIDEFWGTPTRAWLRDLVHPRGPMYDSFRVFHPDTERAFTCWNTLIDARPVNYGTRIDYILTSAALLPWFRDSTVDSDTMGSDHCPVSCVLHDQHPETGESLRVAMAPAGWNMDLPRQPPKLCVKYWDTFAGTQKKLSSFFTAKSGSTDSAPITVVSASMPLNEAKSTVDCEPPSKVAQAISAPSESGLQDSAGPSPKISTAPPLRKPAPAKSTAKRKKAPGAGQTKIAAFFGTKSAAASPNRTPPATSTAASRSDSQSGTITPVFEPAAAHPLATAAPDSNGSNPGSASAPQPMTNAEAEAAASQWRTLLNRPPPPNCYHGEPAKQFTVNKAGPNHRRSFYLCARPVGPEHDPRMDQDDARAAASVNGGDSQGSAATSSSSSQQFIMSSAYAGGRKPIAETRCDFFQWLNPPKRKGGGSWKEEPGPPDKKRKP